MNKIDMNQAELSGQWLRAAGRVAVVAAIVSTVGVVLLVAMYALFVAQNQALGLRVGKLNDICIIIQYALTIPLALVLYRLLLPYSATWIRVTTVVGILAMLAVILLQLALVLGWMTFERQVGWVTLAMVGGVGFWLLVTGLVARLTDKLPHSLAVSLAAVPYLGYPVWAFWLARRLGELANSQP